MSTTPIDRWTRLWLLEEPIRGDVTESRDANPLIELRRARGGFRWLDPTGQSKVVVGVT